MLHRVRRLLLVESAALAAASLVHSGIAVRGHEHWKAATAEGVLAAALLAGLAVTFARPAAAVPAGVAAQAFALLGTCVGAFTIAIGVGPRTLPDVLFHVFLLALLVAGLVLVAPRRAAHAGARP